MRLHAAAQCGDVAAVRGYLGQGIGVDTRNKKSRTALMLAAQNCQPALVELLLRAGANPLLTDSRRRTARDLAGFAANGKQRRVGEVVRLLIGAERAAKALKETSAVDFVGSTVCPVCGASIRQRQRVDYLTEDHRSRYVSNFLQSDALRIMRSHPNHHYHHFLNARQLRKEVRSQPSCLGIYLRALKPLRRTTGFAPGSPVKQQLTASVLSRSASRGLLSML